MADVPGTPDAAYLAFVTVDELISTMIANGILEESQAKALFHNIALRVGADNRAVAKPANQTVGKMIAERGLE